MKPQRFVVILEEAKSEIPVEVRLKRFLKSAWRAYRLRCVSIQPAKE